MESVEYERGGFWRRASALVIDVIVITIALQFLAMALYPLTNGRVQFTGGLALLYCDKLDKVPEGVTIASNFGATSITDCRQGLPGLPSSRILRVSRTTTSGGLTRITQIAHLLDAHGKPIDVPTLDDFSLPLLLVLRFLFDGRRGSPGRQICRIRLAMRADGQAPARAAVNRRYAALMLPLAPVLVWVLSIPWLLGPEHTAARWPLLGTIILSIPALICLIEALHSVIYRKDAWYDRVAGTCVLRLDQARALIPIVATVALETAAENHPSPASFPKPAAQNYFRRHWRGELSLQMSCWVNGVVVGIVAAVAITVLAAIISEQGDDQPIFWMISSLVTWTTAALLVVWQAVGVWRSATRYTLSGKSFWGGAAKTVMILGALSLAYNFLFVGTAQLAGIYEIISGDARVGPHRFRVLANGQMLEFSGGITFGVAKELESFLNAMGNVQTVRLNSNGGRILEAQKMSDIISARGLSTYVARDCLSACTIVFLGGKRRFLLQSARLGFHQPASRGMTAASRRDTIANEEARLQRFGLSKAFAERANTAPPSSMWYPDLDELTREHVVTNVIQPQPKPNVPKKGSPNPANRPVADVFPPVPAVGNTSPADDAPSADDDALPDTRPVVTIAPGLTAPAIKAAPAETPANTEPSASAAGGSTAASPPAIAAPSVGEATPPTAVTTFQTRVVRIPADMAGRLYSQKPPK